MIRQTGLFLFLVVLFIPSAVQASSLKYSVKEDQFHDAKAFCEELRGDPESYQNCKHSFDLDRCAGMTNLVQRNACLVKVAVGRKDYVICQNISSFSGMTSCYLELARQTQSQSVCFRIPPEYDAQEVTAGRPGPQWKCYSSIRTLNPRFNPKLRKLDALLTAPEETSIEARLCASTISPTMDIMQLKDKKVQKCGNFYKVPNDVNKDVPEILLDKAGRKVGSCRAMIEGPDGLSQWGRDKRCDLICEEPDVCRGSLLNCELLDLPSEIPQDYLPQVQYYQKRMIYEYLKTTPQQMKDLCAQINQSRQSQ